MSATSPAGLAADPAPAGAVVPRYLPLLLAALATLSPFSIDTFFPALRALAVQLHVDDFVAQQAFTAYLLPYAAMSLLQGPLSDSLGRRPVIIAGTLVYALASVACVLAPNFPALLAGRILQGASAGAGMIVGRAVVRDLYDGPAAQKLLSVITMLFAVAPAIAPVIGGVLYVHAGWRAIFVFMALLGAVFGAASAAFLPETHPRSRRAPLAAGALIRQAFAVATHREFLPLGLASSLTFGAMLVFIGSAPQIVMTHWHLGATQFAWLFLPVIGGFSIGAALSGRLAGRLSPIRQCALGSGVLIAAAAALAGLYAVLPGPPLWSQQLLLAVIALGVQIVSPPLMLRGLDLFPRARGSAASVQSCLSLLVSTAIFGLVAPLAAGTMQRLALVSLAAGVGGLALWTWAMRYGANRRDV